MSEYLKVVFFGLVWLWCGVSIVITYQHFKEKQDRRMRCLVCGGKVAEGTQGDRDLIVCESCGRWECLND